MHSFPSGAAHPSLEDLRNKTQDFVSDHQIFPILLMSPFPTQKVLSVITSASLSYCWCLIFAHL